MHDALAAQPRHDVFRLPSDFADDDERSVVIAAHPLEGIEEHAEVFAGFDGGNEKDVARWQSIEWRVDIARREAGVNRDRPRRIDLVVTQEIAARRFGDADDR